MPTVIVHTLKRLTEFFWFFVCTFLNTASSAAPHADSDVPEDARIKLLKDLLVTEMYCVY